MTGEEKNEARAVFVAALALNTPEERARYLDEACRDKPELRARVEDLLRAYDPARDFLRGDALGGNVQTVECPVVEGPGTCIGRYKLLEQIGEGGCGVVYMAEQQEPVRRRVALKVIKLGMDTKAVIARFEAERQALALMEHPNIAKVHDAGATETGRPYFVMELVRGIKLTDYCDQNNLSTRDRLDLFIQVCHAIQHAHQKGIIHRDIKPSNILVMMADDKPVPKVIDFGIAKATGQQTLTEKTLFTAFEQFIGTPAYMSPEQAGLSGLDIDRRSDVYSLGVLLFELLTGETPFDTRHLMEAGLDEMRRIIRNEEPSRPSMRLTTLNSEEQARAALRRHTDPPTLIHMLRSDLDWIVMKCLEKERTRRYETSSALATDVQRYLKNEPVAARAPNQLYRLRKAIRRNKVIIGAVTAMGLTFLLGTALTVRLSVREREGALQQLLRETAHDAARKERVIIRQTQDLLLALAGSNPVRAGDRRATKQLLDSLHSSYPRYANIGVVKTNGEVLASAVPLSENLDQSNLPYFRRTLETHAFSGGDYSTQNQSKAVARFGFPVLGKDKEVQAVVFAALDLPWQLQDSKMLRQLPTSATWMQVTEHGEVLTRYSHYEDGSIVGQRLTLTNLLTAIFARPDGFIQRRNERGVPMVYAWTRVNSQLVPGKVVAILGIPKQAFLVGADLAAVRQLPWVAIASVLSIAVGFAVIWLTDRPLARVRSIG